ncbi:enoyl-CoA hydratase/isomerase family protein [Euzebya sp.]|uniref:enoyl-CoA hydratase/isomerase family protein n=1 Tax=Euzebya sp. TaxID=1971409 RepID=UPI0035189EB5
MPEHVSYAVAGGVATLTMDHAETRNALTAELVNGLGDGLARAEADPDVRVVVLTNRGAAFCAGADLKGVSQEEPRYTLVELLDAIQTSATPVVGRIAGHCTGGGVGLAAACDVSLMVADAVMGFTEVRIGVVPAIISVVCLPKMRRGDAMELFLSGEKIAAARAAEVGLVTRAVPPEALDGAVAGVVGAIARGGPEALGLAKRLVNEVPAMDRQAAFAWTAEISAERFASTEAAEGIAAFRERRDAAWVSADGGAGR